jgi:hypothetical protein
MITASERAKTIHASDHSVVYTLLGNGADTCGFVVMESVDRQTLSITWMETSCGEMLNSREFIIQTSVQ